MKKILTLLLVFTLVFIGTGIIGENAPLEVGATAQASDLPGGKNYIDPNNFSVSSSRINNDDSIRVKPNTTYTMTVPAWWDDQSFSIFIEGADSGSTLLDDNTMDSTSGAQWYSSFTTDGDTNYITIEVNYGYMGLEMPSAWSNIQLEEGSSSTTWEAYVLPLTDDTPPLINGATAVYLINVDNPDSVADLKATLTATDDTDGDLTSNITVSRDLYSGNEDTLGDYEVDFSVTDNAGNNTTVTVTFRVVDVVDPIINLLGGTTINVEYGTSFSDPGYTASDNYDPSVTVNVTGSVNDSVLGTYTLYYNATDSTGNTATQRTRTVIVEDTTKPVISLNGASTIYVEFGQNYTELGASWTDTYDGSGSAVKTGNVNVGVLGTYTLNYNYTDSNGNVATQVTRTVIVRDTAAPVLANNAGTYNFNTSDLIDSAYVIKDITATDVYDGNLTGSITIDSETLLANGGTVGSYSITISVTDSQGNKTTEVITVNIVDNEKPVFTTTERLLTHEYADTMTLQDLKDYFGVS